MNRIVRFFFFVDAGGSTNQMEEPPMPKTKSSEPLGVLVNINELSRLKSVPVRRLRTLIAAGTIGYFKLGHKMLLFSPEQFDRDVRAREVKAREVKARWDNGG
jgi:hypothetical protein